MYESPWAKIKVSARLGSFLEEHLFPCLFQFQEAAGIPWLMAPSSVFKVSIICSADEDVDIFVGVSEHYFAYPSLFGDANCQHMLILW